MYKVTIQGDSTLIWKKDGRMISAGDMVIRKDARMKLLDQSLEIADVTEEDAGQYICNVETFGSPLDQVHTVSVLGKNNACTDQTAYTYYQCLHLSNLYQKTVKSKSVLGPA